MENSAYLSMASMEAEHWWFVGRRKVLNAVISRLKLRPNASILELGSGTGGNFSLLEKFGRITAIEMNETAREISKTKKALVDVRAGFLPDHLPLGEQKFDLVCIFDVLEHIDDDAATLTAICNLLAPGGKAIITVPAYKALFGPHDVELHHKRRYEYNELRASLCSAGLKVEKLSYINAGLLPLAWILRIYDRILHRKNASGAGIPNRFLNTILACLFGSEAWLIPYFDLPFGLSLLAVVTRAK